ncbi:DNA-binding transcriptional LysR family regulator [Bradyrhizobium sp. USDA 4461]
MDASDLRVFETVVRVGSITKASSILNTVQSNVTTRIHALEDELGVSLLHRHARGVTPTVAGQKLLPYAMRFADLLAEARASVSEVSPPSGKLSVGTLETTAAIRLPPVLARYKEAFPNVEIAIRTGTTQELVEAVLQYKIEGAFVAGLVRHPELIEEVMFPEELFLVGAPNKAPLDNLLDTSLVLLVLKSGCSYRHQLEGILAARGIVNFRIMELGTIEAIVGLASAGIGISLLPKVVVARAASEGRISAQPLHPTPCRVDTVFIRRADGFFSNSARMLVEQMKQRSLFDAGERPLRSPAQRLPNSLSEATRAAS